MSRTLRILPSLLGATLATFGFAAALHAEPRAAHEPRSLEISYADLDLNRAEDAQELYARIRRAAGQVCWPTAGKALYQEQARRACEHEAIDTAVERVSNPKLTAVYEANGADRTVVAAGR